MGIGGELGDLVRDVVQHEYSGCYQGSTVLEHSLDLSDQRVVDLQRLDRPPGNHNNNTRVLCVGGGLRVRD